MAMPAFELSGCRALPPYSVGAECVRGPHWEESGFGDQDGTPWAIGRVVQPSAADLADWADCWARGERKGSWAPWRSCVVAWPDGNQNYYKCGDGGLFDLGFHPARHAEQGPTRRQLNRRFIDYVRRTYLAHGKAASEASRDVRRDQRETRRYRISLREERWYLENTTWRFIGNH